MSHLLSYNRKSMKHILFPLSVLMICIFPAQAQKVPRSQYAVLEYIPSNSVPKVFPDGYKKTTLSKKEIKQIELILKQCIEERNAAARIEYKSDFTRYPIDYIIVLPKYTRQYVAAISPDGEKIVWVNCFCHSYNAFRDEILCTEDGGECYFNVKINLSKKTYYDLRVNGLG